MNNQTIAQAEIRRNNTGAPAFGNGGSNNSII